MKWKCLAAIASLFGGAMAEPVRSGHATVEWLAESEATHAGSEWRTVLQITIDPGWHIYWTNPGESGTPTSISWKLPDGWQSPDFDHPIPIRFKTGNLVGFGHEGTVRFPARFQVPKHFKGQETLRAVVSWLSCNNNACVPGEAEVTLQVRQGDPAQRKHAIGIAKAFEAKAKPAPSGTQLLARAIDKEIELAIHGTMACDPSASTVFPITPDVVDPAGEIRFQQAGDGWKCRVAASPYLSTPMPPLELLLVPAPPGQPLILKAKKDPAD